MIYLSAIRKIVGATLIAIMASVTIAQANDGVVGEALISYLPIQ